MLTNRNSSSNQAFKLETVTSTILTFLEPKDIPAFASINSSTRNLMNAAP